MDYDYFGNVIDYDYDYIDFSSNVIDYDYVIVIVIMSTITITDYNYPMSGPCTISLNGRNRYCFYHFKSNSDIIKQRSISWNNVCSVETIERHWMTN